MTPIKTMITIVFSSVGFTALNIFLSPYLNVNLLLLADVAVWIGLNMWLSKKISSMSSK